MITSRRESYQAKRLGDVQLSFMAIGFIENSAPMYPKDYKKETTNEVLFGWGSSAGLGSTIA